uniref:Secreted protein n=1 Tax=Caenorhabditis japonica TaxID=281687 RepID=A0A8R1IEP1_CAEJA
MNVLGAVSGILRCGLVVSSVAPCHGAFLKSSPPTLQNSPTQSIATPAMAAGIPSLVDRHLTGSDGPYVLHGKGAGRSVVTPVFRGFYYFKT